MAFGLNFYDKQHSLYPTTVLQLFKHYFRASFVTVRAGTYFVTKKALHYFVLKIVLGNSVAIHSTVFPLLSSEGLESLTRCKHMLLVILKYSL